jgi:hypothetical protein
VEGNEEDENEEGEMADGGLPNIGQWVPSNSSRRLDPNAPISKEALRKLTKKLQRKQKNQKIAAKIMCGVAMPPPAEDSGAANHRAAVSMLRATSTNDEEERLKRIHEEEQRRLAAGGGCTIS